MRLIDADAMEEDLGIGHTCEECTNICCYDKRQIYSVSDICEWLSNQPTIDPIVHGEWIDFNWELGGDGISTELCGKCGQWSYGMGKRYCPHCGAKMDGGEQRYEDEFDVCDSRNGCAHCEHHICKLEQTERSE